jgi:hypothetical protein
MVKLLAAKATLIERHWPRFAVPIGRFLLTMWPLSRWAACSATELLQKAGEKRETTEVWRTIWKSRNDWRYGYPKADHPAGTRLPAPVSLMPATGSVP